MANASLPVASATANGTASLDSVTDLASLWTFILSFAALRDWLKLFVLGGTVETLRRLVSMAWARFLNSFFLTAEVDQYDPAYNWMLIWLAEQPAWKRARAIEINGRSKSITLAAKALKDDEDEDDKTSYLPSYNTPVSFWFNRSWIQVTRIRKELGQGWNSVNNDVLILRVFSRDHKTLNVILRAAKKAYDAAGEDRIDIYTADSQNQWDLMCSRQCRPLSSVILEDKVKQRLLRDCKDFLASEKWYAERGIPWRRGYLLHGSPGSGKTSIIHALAGELGLDVYIFSLAKKNLDDGELANLIGRLPPRSMAIMEDIDVAFYRGVTREAPTPSPSPSSAVPNAPPSPVQAAAAASQTGGTNTITLAGLLSAIDGVYAQEGRILFATTNKYESLDPALSRPGRFDVHIEFKLASSGQAEELFRCFYPATETHESTESIPSTPATPSTTSTLIELDDECDAQTLMLPPRYVSTSPELPSITVEKVKASCDLDEVLPPELPPLTHREVKELAKRFAAAIPDREFSMAALQGFLMQYKTQPYFAVEEASRWVEEERTLKKEREEKRRLEATGETAKDTSVPAPAGAEEKISAEPTQLSVDVAKKIGYLTQDTPAPAITVI